MSVRVTPQTHPRQFVYFDPSRTRSGFYVIQWYEKGRWRELEISERRRGGDEYSSRVVERAVSIANRLGYRVVNRGTGMSIRTSRSSERARSKLSAPKRAWISRKIRLLRREGYGAKQAVAIAYRMAGVARPRKKGTRRHA